MADLDLVRRAAGDHLAVVATSRPDGSVQASLVSAGLFDDPTSGQACVAFVAIGGAHKLALMRRSGRATAVFRDGFRWAAVEGPARIAGPDDPAPGLTDDLPALLRAIFVAAGGSHEDWDEFDRVMAEERRAAVLITPERITGNG
ncbi:MAG TPA: pyridoxamine 5'-phosphate oxidase family protein [Acidimicrobiales bacterium]|nr:pyridoxamine 5'-phosphate oxidase family protein [Acidimicrobiales bacterium]